MTASDPNRNLLLRITDPELLRATGGIVQGMSGSPIVQDGCLVGAVTHVLVNDPTRGYGIFAATMLKAAAKALQIRETGVRPHRRAALFAQRHGALHHQRIACMEATGHIGRCDKRDHLFIHSDGIRAKAFAQVTVQINMRHSSILHFQA